MFSFNKRNFKSFNSREDIKIFKDLRNEDFFSFGREKNFYNTLSNEH